MHAWFWLSTSTTFGRSLANQCPAAALSGPALVSERALAEMASSASRHTRCRGGGWWIPSLGAVGFCFQLKTGSRLASARFFPGAAGDASLLALRERISCVRVPGSAWPGRGPVRVDQELWKRLSLHPFPPPGIWRCRGRRPRSHPSALARSGPVEG